MPKYARKPNVNRLTPKQVNLLLAYRAHTHPIFIRHQPWTSYAKLATLGLLAFREITWLNEEKTQFSGGHHFVTEAGLAWLAERGL